MHFGLVKMKRRYFPLSISQRVNGVKGAAELVPEGGVGYTGNSLRRGGAHGLE
jgi:hypothetical protein